MPEDLAAGLTVLRGKPVTADELLRAGERIVNLERLYNARLGTRAPTTACRCGSHRNRCRSMRSARIQAAVKLSAPTSPSTSALWADPEAMLDRYYRLRGWDGSGLPTADRLRTLGLA